MRELTEHRVEFDTCKATDGKEKGYGGAGWNSLRYLTCSTPDRQSVTFIMWPDENPPSQLEVAARKDAESARVLHVGRGWLVATQTPEMMTRVLDALRDSTVDDGLESPK